MIKKFFQQKLQQAETYLKSGHFKVFGERLFDPTLWHFNSESVAKGVAIGFFIGYLPILGHMILAAFVAILLGANLPVAVACVWISNPFTIPIMFYFAYRFGAFLLHHPLQHFHFEMTPHWFINELDEIYPPMLLGSVIFGLVLAVIGYFLTRLVLKNKH